MLHYSITLEDGVIGWKPSRDGRQPDSHHPSLAGLHAIPEILRTERGFGFAGGDLSR